MGVRALRTGHALHRPADTGIDCVVLEHRDRTYVEQRQRAGILGQGTVDALRACDAAERLGMGSGSASDGVANYGRQGPARGTAPQTGPWRRGHPARWVVSPA